MDRSLLQRQDLPYRFSAVDLTPSMASGITGCGSADRCRHRPPPATRWSGCSTATPPSAPSTSQP